MVKIKWLAALSDGTTAIEGEGPFAVVRGEPSPWQKLLAHLKANKEPTPELPEGLFVTGMRLQVFKSGEATRTYNAPTQQQTPEGNHEKWVALRPVSPVRYDFWRWCDAEVQSGQVRHQAEIRAHFAEGPVLSLFVDEDEGNESWIVPHKNTDQDEKSRIAALK